jgi:hypothetical protein
MSRICDRSFTERASAAASCGDCKTLQITSKQRIWIVTAALAMDFVAESRNDHARVIRRGWGGKYNSGHNNTVAEGAMVSTGPPSIDREPGHRCSPVPTATLRSSILGGAAEISRVGSPPLCPCIFDHNHVALRTGNASAGTQKATLIFDAVSRSCKPRGPDGPGR